MEKGGKIAGAVMSNGVRRDVQCRDIIHFPNPMSPFPIPPFLPNLLTIFFSYLK